jgi:hypothetical protein
VVVRDYVAPAPRGARCLRCASDGLQTATAQSHRCTTHKENPFMDLITNLLAGVLHFVGWLV